MAQSRTVFDKCCIGCEYSGELKRQCTVYYSVPSMYMRAGRCPANPPKAKATGRRVRVGQQKQRRLR